MSFYVSLALLSYNDGKLIVVEKKIDVKVDQNKNQSNLWTKLS